MNYKEIKEICNKLNEKNCYFRHPAKDFVEVLGQETVNKLLTKGWLKVSPKLKPYWIDYNTPCQIYEFGTLFRKIFNFIVNPKWLYFKVYVLQLWRVKCWWQRLRIACGHHYTWQEYEGVDLANI